MPERGRCSRPTTSPSCAGTRHSPAPAYDQDEGRDTGWTPSQPHVRMANAAREAGVVPRRIHLVVAIDRLLVRLLQATPGQWVVKGGYANQLRRPDDARFTEDLDLRIGAAIETAPELLASGFAVDVGDDFSYDVASPPARLEGPPGGGLRFVVVTRLAGTELVRFKVDVSAADVVVGEVESYLSDPVVERLGFTRSRFPVYPVNQHFAEKLHALTLPRVSRTLGLATSSISSGSSATSRSLRRHSRSPASPRSSAVDSPVAARHRYPTRVVGTALRRVAGRTGSA